jgi:hypothetical protein
VKPPPNWAEPGGYFYAANMAEFSRDAQGSGNDWHDGARSEIRLHSISALSDTMTFSMGDIVVPVVAAARRPAIPARPGAYRIDGRQTRPQAYRAFAPAIAVPR